MRGLLSGLALSRKLGGTKFDWVVHCHTLGIGKPKLLYFGNCDKILLLVLLLAAGVIVAIKVASGMLFGVRAGRLLGHRLA